LGIAVTVTPLIEALRRIPEFADLKEDQLRCFASNSEDLHFATGDVVVEGASFPLSLFLSTIAVFRRHMGAHHPGLSELQLRRLLTVFHDGRLHHFLDAVAAHICTVISVPMANDLYVVGPADGNAYDDTADFTAYQNFISRYRSSNLKIVAIGAGATFVNNVIAKHAYSVAGIMTYGGALAKGAASTMPVPAYVHAADPAVGKMYIDADGATSKQNSSDWTTYSNTDKDHLMQRVVVSKLTDAKETPGQAFQNAWKTVFSKNYRLYMKLVESYNPAFDPLQCTDPWELETYVMYDELGIDYKAVVEDMPNPGTGTGFGAGGGRGGSGAGGRGAGGAGGGGSNPNAGRGNPNAGRGGANVGRGGASGGRGGGAVNAAAPAQAGPPPAVVKALHYEYIPKTALNSRPKSVPLVVMLHGNGNDPRTQGESAGWPELAAKNNIILISVEWQGRTANGVQYAAIGEKGTLAVIDEMLTKYPQIDPGRVYFTGLSAGAANSITWGSQKKILSARHVIQDEVRPFSACDGDKQHRDRAAFVGWR
jgi:hypothetical protein